MSTASEIRAAQAAAHQQRVGLYFLPDCRGWWFRGHIGDSDAVQRVGEYERLRHGHSPKDALCVTHGFARFGVVGRRSRTGYRELQPAEPGTQGAFRVTLVLLDPDTEWGG